MHRRHFLSTVAASAGVVGASMRIDAANSTGQSSSEPPKQPFTLRYGPHFGMFRQLGGADLVDHLKFAADQGFRAWEDNEMKSRPVEDQRRIAAAMEQLGMELGVISALRGVWSKVNFAGEDQNARDEVLAAMKQIIDVARRGTCKKSCVNQRERDNGGC